MWKYRCPIPDWYRQTDEKLCSIINQLTCSMKKLKIILAPADVKRGRE
jgi:hypothetical protein